MKNQSQIKKNRLTRGGKAQRKSGKKRAAFSLPKSATRRPLKQAADEEERKELLLQKVAFIERNGTAEQKLSISILFKAMVGRIRERKLGNTEGSQDYEFFLISEVIRHSRTLYDQQSSLYLLRCFARSLPSSHPARKALTKAIATSSPRKRDELLDLIQVGAFSALK